MAAEAIDWAGIDTVLLDMDGTLLDLRFDNWFWLELVPIRYAELRGIGIPQARQILEPKFLAAHGTIDWYCIEYWSRELELDIAAIKRAAREEVGYLPGALEFLLRLKQTGKRLILVTNAHPMTLAIKNERVDLTRHFDACYSAHPFRAPKEDAAFWPRLNAADPFCARRTLMVDDNLAVLRAADNYGIGWLRAVRCPDSGRPAQDTGHFASVDRVADLLA